jgi:hypothetical protein
MIIIPLVFLILYVAFCWLLAFVGRNAKFSFWGNFWVSIIFTPIIGILVLLAQDLRPEKRKSSAGVPKP